VIENRSLLSQMAETSVNGGPRHSPHAAVGLSGGPSVPDYFAKILKNKDRIIRVQAKRIELLETEVERLRVARETISTQLALVSYKLELATASTTVLENNAVSSEASASRQDNLLQSDVSLGKPCKYVRHLRTCVLCQSVRQLIKSFQAKIPPKE